MERSRQLRLVALPFLAALACGCSPGYLLQAAAGEMAIVRARKPIDAVIADQASSPALRRKLTQARSALSFAHADLALPDNGSFREYADLGRPYAVWNVFAAPEFSLDLETWCFPVSGCVAYRGYFDSKDARDFADALAARGDDVYVGGAAAYSTLGFFRDPLLSTVAGLPDAALAGLIFHELAHERLYVPGDTVFNESFATLVEEEGTIRWLERSGDSASLCAFLDGLARQREVQGMLADARARLRAVYESPGSVEERRAAKAAEFERLRERYRAARAGWSEPPYFDGWFAGALNNASLGADAAYDRLVGTLRVILDAEGGSLPAFYRRAERLGRLSAKDRAAVLREITSPTLRQPGPVCVSGPVAADPGFRDAPTGSAGSGSSRPAGTP